MAIGDGFERGLEVGVRVDAVHLGCFGQRSDAGPGRRTLVVAGEQGILAIQRQWPDGVFHHNMPISAYRRICRQLFYADTAAQAVDGPGRSVRFVGIKEIKSVMLMM